MGLQILTVTVLHESVLHIVKGQFVLFVALVFQACEGNPTRVILHGLNSSGVR